MLFQSLPNRSNHLQVEAVSASQAVNNSVHSVFERGQQIPSAPARTNYDRLAESSVNGQFVIPKDGQLFSPFAASWDSPTAAMWFRAPGKRLFAWESSRLWTRECYGWFGFRVDSRWAAGKEFSVRGPAIDENRGAAEQ